FCSPARRHCATAVCRYASRRTANACSLSNSANCRGPKWTPGGRNCTATSNAPWLKRNCPNGQTTSPPTASSSKHDGKRRLDGSAKMDSLTSNPPNDRLCAAVGFESGVSGAVALVRMKPTIKIYIGRPVSGAEANAVERLHSDLSNRGTDALLLVNFQAKSRQIDCVVVTATQATLLDFKEITGPVRGGVNGLWFIRAHGG